MPEKSLTRNQRKRIRQLISVKGNASEMPGYKNPNSARSSISQMLNRGNVRLALKEEFEKLGYGIREIVSDLISLSKCKKEIPVTYQGKIHDTAKIPDNTTRLNALSLIGKFIGIDKTCDIYMEQEVDVIDFSQLTDDELDLMIERGKEIERDIAQGKFDEALDN